MSYTDQKEIAQTLDTLANRAHQFGGVPATSKQCWFLAKLIDAKDLEWMLLDSSKALTKSEASRLIDSYLKEGSAA